MTLAAVFGLSIRHSVTTGMAVGQVAFFRSVTRTRGNASKIATCAHFIGTCTLARFGRGFGAVRGILTSTISRPCLLETHPLVPLSVRPPGGVHRLGGDTKRLEQPGELFLGE